MYKKLPFQGVSPCLLLTTAAYFLPLLSLQPRSLSFYVFHDAATSPYTQYHAHRRQYIKTICKGNNKR